VGELPLEMQAKILRFLQEKEVRPVGSNQKVKVDVRIMAATNRDLDTEYKRGTFRKDLYFRLNVVTISLPPLRERRSDIPILAAFFLERLAPGRGVQLSGEAMKALLVYDWPGNVRELENCLERAVALGDQRIIEVSDLPPVIVREEVQAEALDSGEFSRRVAELRATDLRATDLEDIERATIERVFSQVKGDKALAGKMLGISRATLYRKLKRYNIGGHEEPPQSTTLQ
jgi:two-component system response regulator AtoC